ncbi:MAG: hypothetical protein ACTSVY_04940 [Candidatus Helarchaeota archaeon]
MRGKLGERIKEQTYKCFEKDYKLTIGVDIFSEEVALYSGAERVLLSIWDINRAERFKFFRTSFYKGCVGALIVFDLTNRQSFEEAIELINEIRQSAGSVPIFLFGSYQNNDSKKISLEEIEELNKINPCFYFENAEIKTIWSQLAEHLFKFVTGLDIQTPQYRAYIENFKRSKKYLNSILRSLGFKVIKDHVDILNKHGLFSINLNNGKTYFEPISCSDCKHRKSCKKKKKKFICIVQKSNFSGWSNVDLLTDDILVLSKVFAISEDQLPKDVKEQMTQHFRSCMVV